MKDCISLIISICSFIISLTTLIISLINFIRYDRKIKKQNCLINQYQIQQIEEKKCAQNSAKIFGSIIRGKMGMRTLVIINKGLATAKNFHLFDIRDNKGIFQTDKLSAYDWQELAPEGKIEVPFIISESAPDTIRIKCIWDDDHKTGNIYQQNLQL